MQSALVLVNVAAHCPLQPTAMMMPLPSGFSRLKNGMTPVELARTVAGGSSNADDERPPEHPKLRLEPTASVATSGLKSVMSWLQPWL